MTRSVFNFRRGGAGQTLLIADSFNRSNRALNGDNTDGAGSLDPTAWTDQLGTWNIATNKARTTVAPGIATVQANTADVDVTVTCSTADVNQQGIVVRLSDASNYIRMFGDNTQLRITKIVAGVSTNIANLSSVLASGDVLRLVASGNKFYGFQNGVLKNSGSDSFNNTATLVGMISGGTSQRFDDFSVYDAP